MKAKMLAFAISYFSESSLFNELRSIQIEKILSQVPAPGLAENVGTDRPGHSPSAAPKARTQSRH
jgi:hypothetical protein